MILTNGEPFGLEVRPCEIEPVSETLCRISTSDCVCVLLCVCVYLYWYFGPPLRVLVCE
jgi:hypothetical protein